MMVDPEPAVQEGWAGDVCPRGGGVVLEHNFEHRGGVAHRNEDPNPTVGHEAPQHLTARLTTSPRDATLPKAEQPAGHLATVFLSSSGHQDPHHHRDGVLQPEEEKQQRGALPRRLVPDDAIEMQQDGGRHGIRVLVQRLKRLYFGLGRCADPLEPVEFEGHLELNRRRHEKSIILRVIGILVLGANGVEAEAGGAEPPRRHANGLVRLGTSGVVPRPGMLKRLEEGVGRDRHPKMQLGVHDVRHAGQGHPHDQGWRKIFRVRARRLGHFNHREKERKKGFDCHHDVLPQLRRVPIFHPHHDHVQQVGQQDAPENDGVQGHGWPHNVDHPGGTPWAWHVYRYRGSAVEIGELVERAVERYEQRMLPCLSRLHCPCITPRSVPVRPCDKV
mmetsp:Transcript_15234/g.39161  ORF Transcript_15234/g.39161 Transcript_15234/m.39161 type:complete len:389 (+) Transcript_15234:173-1339(+)